MQGAEIAENRVKKVKLTTQKIFRTAKYNRVQKQKRTATKLLKHESPKKIKKALLEFRQELLTSP